MDQENQQNTRRSIPLTEKLPLYFIFVGLISILIVGAFSYYNAQHAMLDRTYDQLTSVRIEKQKRIENFFYDALTGMQLLQSADQSKKLLLLHQISEEDKNYQTILNDFTNFYFRFFKLNQLYSSFVIGCENGIRISFDEQNQITTEAITPQSSTAFLGILQKHQEEIASGNQSIIENEYGLFVLSQLCYEEECLYFFAQLNQDYINNIMMEINPHNGLGKSGEVYLVNQENLMKSQSRFIDEAVGKIKVNSKSVDLAFQGKTGTHLIDDYRGISVLSSYSLLQHSNIEWAVLSEIDRKEAMIPIERLRNQIIIISLFIVMILLIISYWLSHRLTRPIIHLKQSANEVAKGKFDEQLKIESNDEIGELTESFNHMVSQLKSKTNELKTERVKQLRSMIDGQEYERQRFSRELHDGLGQSLFAMKMSLEEALSKDEAEGRKQLNILKEKFDTTIEEVRRMSNNLKPAVLENFGVARALENLCSDTAETASFNLIYSIDEPASKIARRTQTYIFRMVQEALNNTMKHASAENVSVNFYEENNLLIISIEDDGLGFNPQAALHAGGNGLSNLKERVNLLRGQIDIRSEKNRGTIIFIKIPISCAHESN